MTQKDKFKEILARFMMDVEDTKIFNALNGEVLEEALNKSATIAYKEAKALFKKKC